MKFLIGAMVLVLGLVAVLAATSGGTDAILGMDGDSVMSVVYLTVLLLFIGSFFFAPRESLGTMAKQALAWVAIILVLMGGYVFRYDLQDIASRFTGGVVPGSPITARSGDGVAVTLVRSPSGHFEAVAGVNDASIRFLVDTGATSVVLSHADAAAAGLTPDDLAFTIRTQTANGTGRAAPTRIERLYLGGIERRNVPAMVAEKGRLGQSLLGQTFLESLSGYSRRGDRLTLTD